MSGEELKAIRQNLGITQKELALRLGICQTLISAYENGRRRIPRKLADKISRGEF